MRAKISLAPCALVVGILLVIAATFTAAQTEQSVAAPVASFDPSKVTTTTIPSTLFGMSAHSDVLFQEPWPTMPITGMRLWDTKTGWGQLNTAKGVYDWTTLDDWIATAQSHNQTLVYTFGYTPAWASSKPTDSSCDNDLGSCDPPADLKSDGTGTDQHFIDFVTAIAQHAPSILYWEMWNTPHDIKQWTGTDAQLVRMTKDAHTYIKKYIPGAKIISIANGQLRYSYPAANCTMPDKMGSYLAAGGSKYIDIVGFHTYYTTTPENIVPVVQCYQSTMSKYKISSLPLWSTEGSWGVDADLPGATDQAGFVARLYLLLWSNGVVRHYWYDWDDDITGTLETNGVLNPAGIAYTQVESWMSGRTMSTLCSENSSSIWTCGLTGSNGYAAQAVWSTAGNQGYTAPSQYVNYLDLSGNQHTISSGASVTVGVEPILLQNQGATTNPDFSVSEPSVFPNVKAGTTGTSGPILITSEDGFASSVNLTCPSTYGANSCSISPAAVATFPATVNLVVNGTSFTPGSYQLSVEATSGSLSHSVNVPFNVGDFSITGPATLSSAPSATATASIDLASLYSYSGQVNATCDASALAGAVCTLSAASPISIGSGATVPVTATITVPSTAVAGTYNIVVTSQDTSGTSSHSVTIALTIASQDFGFGAFTPATQTVTPGQTATYNFSVNPVGASFSSAVNLACSGAPTISTCSFSTNPVTPGNNPATVTMTITTTASSASLTPGLRGNPFFYASWMMLPAVVLLAGTGRRRKSAIAISLLALLVLAMLVTSCGGGTGSTQSQSTGGGGGVTHQQGTTPGAYTITVTGTSGTLTHQAQTVALVVNQ